MKGSWTRRHELEPHEDRLAPGSVPVVSDVGNKASLQRPGPFVTHTPGRSQTRQRGSGCIKSQAQDLYVENQVVCKYAFVSSFKFVCLLLIFLALLHWASLSVQHQIGVMGVGVLVSFPILEGRYSCLHQRVGYRFLWMCFIIVKKFLSVSSFLRVFKSCMDVEFYPMLYPCQLT